MEIVVTLRNAGYTAYFAGGCVRDQLLGVTPKDYDIATSAHPADITSLFDRTLTIGAHFGVIEVIHMGVGYDVATFRADLDYHDGRRPEGVVWCGAKEDALRRDFTINGLFYDPVDDAVIDHVNGRSDLAAGVLRTIGDPMERFTEDRLRVLRAVRFAARLEFQIENETWSAMETFADDLDGVSAERIHGELTRILTEGGAGRGIRLLEKSGLLRATVPEASTSEPLLSRLDRSPAASPRVGWTLLLLDVSDPARAITDLGRRLRMSTTLVRDIQALIAQASALRRYETLAVAARKRLLREESVKDAFFVSTLDAEGSATNAKNIEMARSDHATWTADELWPPALLDGHALRGAGHSPGPRFKPALRALEDGQLDGSVQTVADAWAVVDRILNEP